MSNAHAFPPRPAGSTSADVPPRPAHARLNPLTLEQLFAGPPPFVFRPGRILPPDQAPWIIYVISHRATGRCYVGLTVHTLADRIARHLSNARRVRRVRAGGLMEALRAMLGEGRTFAGTFAARIVARAPTAEEAAVQEARWMEMLQCRAPHGYNQMPAGGVGCVANASRLVVEVTPGTREAYRSIYAAIGDANVRRRCNGRPQLDPGVVYARLAARWTPEEALEYRPHRDGRGERAMFRIGGRTHTSLREASAATGFGIDALRSRLHRAKRCAPGIGIPDVTEDRRLDSPGRGQALGIVWPGTGEGLTAEEFGRRTNVPKSSVIHRAHRVQVEQENRRRAGLEPLTPEEVRDRLTLHTDRRVVLRLQLPCGEPWVGGERELIRRMFTMPRLERARCERLSESGIRRRLRLLSPEDRRDPGQVAEAFGFGKTGPRGTGPMLPMLLVLPAPPPPMPQAGEE